jgi:predicted dehydrogenase
MIKVGIIGCGKQAGAHVEVIRSISDCEIVGCCDKEELMAKQLCKRFKVKKYFNDESELLQAGKAEVVHITTSPQSHFELGKLCLEAGVHVYIEKPFTINLQEAKELIDLANRKGLNITVGHDQQFTRPALKMRKLVKNGYLGDSPVAMESIYGYDFGDPIYARSLLNDKEHWVRKLPGKLMQNIISHGISKIVEFLKDDNPKIMAHGFTSPFLKSIGEYDIIDELRVIIYDKNDITAFFTFSSQMRPMLHLFRIYGLENSLVIDYNQETVIKMRGAKYRMGMERFIPSFSYAKQYMSNALSNIGVFMKKDFGKNYGLKSLIWLFYKSIIDNSEPPIPYREIVLTSAIMDAIFEQLAAQRKEMV